MQIGGRESDDLLYTRNRERGRHDEGWEMGRRDEWKE